MGGIVYINNMKTIRISTAFFITLTAIVLASFFVVQFAHANSPIVDTLDTGVTSPWFAPQAGTSLPDEITSGCYSGHCTQIGNYGGYKWMAYTISTAGTGEIKFYYKAFNSTDRVGISWCATFTYPGGCGTNYLSNWTPPDYDGQWHYAVWAWKPGTTYTQLCILNDTQDLNSCSWSESNTIPNNTTSWTMNIVAYSSSNIPMLDEFSGIGATITNTTTRFDSFTPSPDSEVGTSTNFTFGATGYVNESEISSSTKLYIRYRQQTGMGIRGNSTLSSGGEFNLDINSSGAFNLSTTTSILNTGVYLGYMSIQKPRYSLFGFEFFTNVLTAQTFLFTVGTSTETEKQSVIMLLGTTGLGQGLASSTLLTGNLGACQNFLTGSTTDCLISLVVPSSEQLIGAGQTMSNTLATNMPFSFFWTIYEKINSITGSTTPTQGSDVAIHGLLGTGTTTMFSWSSAKTTLDTVIPENTSKYLVWSEWIIFSGYALLRIIMIL